MFFRKMTSVTAAAALMAFAGAGSASETAANAEGETPIAEKGEDGRIEIGYLECDMTADGGNIIVTEQEFICVFDSAEEGFLKETYTASITKIGLDLSQTTEEKIRWGVFAPAERYENGVLEGEYAGVSADVALGAGIGAKALVGGFKDSIALQPLSVSTQEGVGLALGVENLTLKFVADRS